MPVKDSNRRVMATITREQDDLLAELGAFQGRSKGSYLSELLDGAEPLLRSLVPVLRVHAATIEGQPVAVRDVVARVMTGAYGDDRAIPELFAALDKLADAAERTAPSEAREDRTDASAYIKEARR